MDTNLRSLSELINEILDKENVRNEFKKIGEFINSPQKCWKFMNILLRDKAYGKFDPKVYQQAKDRAKHSVVTYLLGKVLMPFENIIYMENNYKELWLKTSLYHDYGYGSEYIIKENLNLRKDAKIKRYLLQDIYQDKLSCLNKYSCKHPEDFAYTYNLIELYFKYSIEYKKNNNKEKSDHGILGGTLVFNSLSGKFLKLYRSNKLGEELKSLKKFCLAIAQHNIYKIEEKYLQLAKTISDDFADNINKVIIDERKPLLLFLSLVDTVECVKKFCNNESKKGSHNFSAKIFLEKLYLSVEQDKIILDFSVLRQHAKMKDKGRKISIHDANSTTKWFEKTFCSYASGVESFSTWTVLDGICDGDRITITKK